MNAVIEKRDFYHDIIECLVRALEAKDQYTKGHSIRVGDMAYDLGKEIGLDEVKLEKVHIAGHLHDIGKIGVPDNVLNKQGKLTESEWNHIKTHPKIGSDILSKSYNLSDISKVVLHHHERWDGKGYPYGLKGASIPLGSRIIAICDSIDAMVSHRPYRNSLSWKVCRKEVEINAGKQFDPTLVKYTKNLWKKWINYYSNN